MPVLHFWVITTTLRKWQREKKVSQTILVSMETQTVNRAHDALVFTTHTKWHKILENLGEHQLFLQNIPCVSFITSWIITGKKDHMWTLTQMLSSHIPWRQQQGHHKKTTHSNQKKTERGQLQWWCRQENRKLRLSSDAVPELHWS